MLFEVFQSLPVIRDPDNPDIALEGIETVVGTLKIYNIFENMSFGLLQPLDTEEQIAKKLSFKIPPVDKESILQRPISRGDIVRLKGGTEIE